MATLGLAGLVVPGCAENRPVSVGIHPWVGYETLYFAREFHWLDDAIALREHGSAGGSLAAINQGHIEAACLTLDEVLRARDAGTPLQVIAVVDVSAGADVLVARPGIGSLSELAGRRIGVEVSALGQLMLALVLERAGLPAAAVELVDLAPDAQLEAWRGGHIDAAITYEPPASLLVREGGRRLFNSRQAPETIFDVIAVRRDRIAGRRTTLRSLIAAHFRGLAHLQTNRQDAIHRIATRQGLTPAEVRVALAGIALPSVARNLAYLQPDSRLVGAAARISHILAQSGAVSGADELDDFVSAAYLPDTRT